MGVSTNHPWSDPKHGIVFLKKDIVGGEDGVQVESNLIASRLHEALIRFGSARLPDDGQTIEEGTLPVDSRARQERAMQSGGKASASIETYRRITATFENFVDFMLPPKHPEKVRQRAVKRALAENDTSYRVTEPADLDAVMQFLTLMSAPWEKEYSADAEYGGVLVRGRGCGCGSVKNFVSALQHIDKQLMAKTNITDQRVADFLRDLENVSPPMTSAKAFDIAGVVPRWCDAIYEADSEGRPNPFNTDILRIIVHTMFMTELATCARRSLFTKYCPRRDQVTLGPVDALGIPKYYILKLDRWKGNERRKKKQTLLTKRNYINSMYCPVVAMTVWLKVLNDVAPGHKNGPLVPCAPRRPQRVHFRQGRSHADHF